MSVLVIETSNSVPTVAYRDDAGAVAVREGARGIPCSENLAALVAAVLVGARPDTVVVSKGPGSATGIRVGAAFGRGLADSLGAAYKEVLLIDAFAASKRPAAFYRGADKACFVDGEGQTTEAPVEELPERMAASDRPVSVTADLFERMGENTSGLAVIGNAAAEILSSGIWK